jgi:hypothetical protein
MTQRRDGLVLPPGDEEGYADMLVEAFGVVALQGGVEQLPLLRERLPPAQPLLQDHVVRRCRVRYIRTRFNKNI